MQQGMSLIELLIVVAVIGILAAIAYPSYSDPLRRAARSEVVGLLHDAALRLEHHRVRTGQYAEGDLDCLSPTAITACRPFVAATPSRCSPGACRAV